jgi:arylsulfatase
MTGRYSIRSGNHTVALAGSHGGLVKWEKTLGDILSASGYATATFGKWHIGDSEGRWPTDHGFDVFYGPQRTYDEALWTTDPWYDPNRDPKSFIVEGKKGEKVREAKQLTIDVRREIDAEYLARAKDFMRSSTAARRPFFLYFNHSMMHLPTIPRKEFVGKTGNGDWADSLLELDSDFKTILENLRELGVADSTIVGSPATTARKRWSHGEAPPDFSKDLTSRAWKVRCERPASFVIPDVCPLGAKAMRLCTSRTCSPHWCVGAGPKFRQTE